jgi:acyl transferase domain-containing protein/NADPH:quinone reductase-like Zn-dependent oxidoreductase/acyl carrier protein
VRKVAIVAASFRLPGTTPALFWQDLLAGRDLVTHVEPGRWEWGPYLHPDRAHPGSAYTFAAGSIGDAAGFDAAFFGISPREASLIDPQQRVLLELSWETFENAGIRPSSLRGSDCGVYLGISTSDYAWRMADDLAAIDASFATGNTASIAANRLSYFYDLRGPSMALDTACSSSLVAFHQGHQAIASGECAQALVGAISLHLHPLGFVSFSKASMLSKTGRCRVFDAAADGYVRSEGGGLLLLKDYDLAVADGNPILAIVAHSSVNTDGHKSGITVPSSTAQAALLTRAYQQAGIDPAQIDYLEAHGTGTAVGDPIEAHALGEALARHRPRSQPLLIGSVKGNVGHLETASGVAGLVKVLYCLQHRVIPAHIGMETPNPRIPFRDLNLEVVTDNRSLRTHGPLVIGVNSFGFGGANAHVILRNHVSERRSAAELPRANPLPIMISARDETALKVAARELAHYLVGQPQSALYDVAYQLVHGREQHPHRAMLFGRTPAAVAGMLERFALDTPESTGVESGTPVAAASGPAFIYSGNGAQWFGMGRELLADPTFRAAVRKVDTLFSRYASYSLESELAGENGDNRYDLTEVAQPALFAVQVGITAMLRRRGVTPVAVAGHSVGEVAAAWAAGALSLAAAVSVIHHRSALQGTTKGAGGMTAVSLSEAGAQGLLAELDLTELVCIAGVNSSCGVTIAGELEALEWIEKTLKARGVASVRLALDYAFHSPAMDKLHPELRRSLAHLEPEDTTVPFYSTVTGDLLSGKSLDADYWWRNIRHPVLFEPALRSMVQAGINIYLEIGPHAPLNRYIHDALTDARSVGRVIVTGMRADNSPQRIFAAASQTMLAGARVDWQRLFPWRGRPIQLPNYPWQRERYWHSVTSASFGLISRRSTHPLLGHALRQLDLTWENELDTVRQPLFGDHVVGGATVFPGTGYAELALAMAFQWQPAEVAEIEDLEIRAPLLLAAEPARAVRCEIDAADGQLLIRSREYAGNDAWSVQAVGRILREPASHRMQRSLGELPTRRPDFTARSHERLTLAAGLQYGPCFKAVSHGWINANEALGVLEVPAALEADLSQYHLHPALLDCAFQLIIQLLRDRLADYEGVTFVPTRIGHLSCRGGAQPPRYARVRLLHHAPHSLCAEYEIFDATGQTIAVLEEVRLRSVRLQRSSSESIRYLEYVAVPRPRTPPLQAAGEQLHARLDGELQRCFEHAAVQRVHAQYAGEVEPLLDALCERFTVESLRILGACEPPPSPYYSRLAGLTQAEVAATDDSAAIDETQRASAQDIWNSLIDDYPDFFPLIQAVGCVGVRLPQLWQQQRTLAQVLPPHLTPEALRRPVVGTQARLQLLAALRSRIEGALRELKEGERLGLVEISADAPLFAPELCRDLDFDRADYCYLSSQPAALEAARRLQEMHAALVVQSFDQGEIAADCSIAIVTLDFRSLTQALRALECARTRLAPGGVLLVLAQHPSRALDFVFGADPHWWDTSTPETPRSAQQPPAFFEQYLLQLGLVELRRHEHSTDRACGAYALLASQTAAAKSSPRWQTESPRGHWLLLADASGDSDTLATAVARQLQAEGDRVSRVVPADAATIAQTFRAALGRDGPLTGIVNLSGLGVRGVSAAATVLERQVERCATAAALIQACESLQTPTPCWFVTANAAAHLLPGRAAPESGAGGAIVDAALAGFARTLMNEGLIGALRLIDLEVTRDSVAALAAPLARELRTEDAEQEIILTTAGARYAPRLRFAPSPRGVLQSGARTEPQRRVLGFSAPGQLRNLQWQTQPRRTVAPGEVEVAVEATGLNFRDVMYALGLLSDEGVEQGFAGASLGLEFSGTVIRLGLGVEDIAVGDAVVGFAPSSFGDYVITHSGAVSRIPCGLSFEAAATIPSTFFTAYYALHHLAGLAEGEKVLIHGAAGGVGLAAIQVAKWRGAEVFATVGSEEKRTFVHLLGADHILDSRSLAYADQILEATGGRGVDVVLNSLAGEAINRNFRVLRPFGRFLELGKRDYYENTRIGLRPFRNNISYFGIDADQLMRERPQLTQRLFGEMLQLFHEGILHALPYQAFEAREVIDAFRHMQQARQLGKIVVTYGTGIPAAPQALVPGSRRLKLPSEATYLVTGGLGGFGLRTAEWLVERGARHLVLLGRRGACGDEAQTALARLERRGIRVLSVACDVTDHAAIAAVLDQIRREWPPLRGVVHAATVIEDALVRDMTAAQMHRVLAPKVLGALHLHELTRTLALDFFVLYSSATTLFGNPGQGNYVAANSALEALGRMRRAAGLPATCVRWGAIDDVGFLARSPKLKQALVDRMGGAALQSAVALEELEAMLLAGRPDLGILELDWRALRRFLPSATAAKFIEIARGAGHGDAEEEGGVDLERLLRDLPEDELLSTVSNMLKAQIGEILRIAPAKIDAARPVQEMGFDSLMGVELAVAVEQRFGVRLPVLALSDSPTVLKLAGWVIQQLRSESGASRAAVPTDATRAQIEHIASQHAVVTTDAAELERFAAELRHGEPGGQRRMIQ